MTQLMSPPGPAAQGITAGAAIQGNRTAGERRVEEHATAAAGAGPDFFVAPPAEIGPIGWAQSTLKLGRPPWPLGVRFGVALLAGALVGAVVATLFVGVNHRNAYPAVSADQAAIWGFGPAAAVLGIAAVLWLTRFQHSCSYVGSHGVARYTVRGGRGRTPEAEGLLFKDAAELRTHQVRHYLNGIHTGTRYSFRWTDTSGNVLLHLQGTHGGDENLPGPQDAFHFALAAEQAWSQHLMAGLAAQLEHYGFVHFNVKAHESVRVGRGFLEFNFGGQVQRIAQHEIARLQLGQGMFLIQHKDPGSFGGRGSFSFEYGNMANVRLFLFALENLLGYRFN